MQSFSLATPRLNGSSRIHGAKVGVSMDTPTFLRMHSLIVASAMKCTQLTQLQPHVRLQDAQNVLTKKPA
jgi:hypothetical protein